MLPKIYRTISNGSIAYIVCACHVTVPGSNPKYTIMLFAFIVNFCAMFVIVLRKRRAYAKRGRGWPFFFKKNKQMHRVILPEKIGKFRSSLCGLCDAEFFLMKILVHRMTSSASNLASKQCDQIWRTLAALVKFLAIFYGLCSIWQNCKPTLVNFLCYWAIFHCCQWPKIGKIIQPSGHTASKFHQFLNRERRAIFRLMNRKQDISIQDATRNQGDQICRNFATLAQG